MDPIITPRALRADVHAAARAANYTPLQAHVLAGRIHDGNLDQLPRRIQPLGSDLARPDGLPDLEVAVDRLAFAIERGEQLAIASDHDVDGASGQSVAWTALVEYFGYPAHMVQRTVSRKSSEGYGFSEAYTDRLLATLGTTPTVILGIDQGSTNEPTIARLKQAGHTVLIADHHGLGPDGAPRSALATVNPIRRESTFGDPTISGCAVAWYVMVALREELIRRGRIPAFTPRLSSVVDLVAASVVADCVDMSRQNNRVLVRQGLTLMQSHERPCWRALRSKLKRTTDWDEQALGWILGPRLNSAGRCSDALISVAFLLAKTEDEAAALAEQLETTNTERRALQDAMMVDALPMAQAAVDAGRYGLCLWFEDGFAGVHGVCASRLVEAFGRPTLCLSPFEPDPELATGSIRTTDRVHVLEALRWIQSQAPGLAKSAGGHKGAGGIKVARKDIPTLIELWDEAVRRAYGADVPVPTVLTDGAPPTHLSLASLAELAAIGPWGRQFETPIFSEPLRVLGVRAVGGGRHLKLTVQRRDGLRLDAIWFGAVPEGQEPPVAIGMERTFAYELDANEYRGTTSLQLRIKAVEAEPMA